MDKNWQSCLIQHTIAIQEEEEIINSILNDKFSKSTTIIVYGTNSNDESIYSKYDQLVKLGIKNVFVYTGGMFEWLLLQDIYGRELFPTTSRELDIIKYKPQKQLNILYIDA
jgi:3-mercaptopyruvate sulfurtransferase SseA